MDWKGLPIVIFGTGGISKEVFQIIQQINDSNLVKVYDFIGFIGKDIAEMNLEVIGGYRVVSYDNEFIEFTENFRVLGAVIPNGLPEIKREIYRRIVQVNNLVYPNIIHPNVVFDSKTIKMGFGNIIGSGVSLTCEIIIGNFNLINLNNTIGHNIRIGDYNVLNPLVSISGNVEIGDGCLIGTGANILQNLVINSDSIVGAGAVVIKDVEKSTTVVGVPARIK
ncbi:MAG: acetyltransferase [Bacillota bacterium]|nr:acetyltransferase [Bacillota bacterium]